MIGQIESKVGSAERHSEKKAGGIQLLIILYIGFAVFSPAFIVGMTTA